MRTRLTLLVLLAAGFAPAEEAEEREGFDRYHRTVFFAVLEGAFDDGVADGDIDRLLAVDAETGDFRNFAYGCPVCMPAMDALRTYRNRGEWPYKVEHGRTTTNTFGRGLEPHLRRALAADDRESQWKAVQTLLERWVARHMDRLRMTAGEREDLGHALEDMRKRGMEVLRSSKAMGGAKRCAACDGANAAVER